MENHLQYMQRCLDLAARGLGNVAPNPQVGSVIVHNGRIIGEGYHHRFGLAHAEVNAINSVSEEDKSLIPEATMYVSLEPCSHHGKTPPCADLIVHKQVKKVVIASKDPNPLVAGKGIEKLKQAGVEVVTDVMKNEADFINRRFMTFFIKHRPYIILKWAQSADGFIAPDEPKQVWLSSEASRRLVHQWRGEEQAILVGRNTVEIDNPELTVRLTSGKNPTRIVIDRSLSLSKGLKVFNDHASTIVYNQNKDAQDAHISYAQIDFSKNVLTQILSDLYQRQIQSVIIEGGAETLQHFVEEKLWDEARIFTSSFQLNSGKKAPLPAGKLLREEIIDRDKLQIILP